MAMFRLDDCCVNATEGFEVWLDKPCVPPRLPLMYFMGHQVMPYSDMVIDQLPLFTHAKFGTAFSDIFDLNDLAVLNNAMRRRYNDLDVKPFLYVRKGAWDEEKPAWDEEVTRTFKSSVVRNSITFTSTPTSIHVEFDYKWKNETHHGAVDITQYPPATPDYVWLSVTEEDGELVVAGESLDAKPFVPLEYGDVLCHIPQRFASGNYSLLVDETVYTDGIKRTYTEVIHHPAETIHHPAEKKVDRELTLDRLEDICIDIGMMHHDEWLGFKNIAKKYYEKIDDGDIYNNIDVTKETINATDVESGSIKNEGTQTPNGWKSVTTPTGSESDTITNYRSPNTTDDTFYKQTKTEQGKSFTNRKTETEQLGTMDNDVTTTFNDHTHTANGTFTEKGYRGRDMVNTLTRMFNRPGMEWLNKVLDEIIYDILIISKAI